jgi:Skp family chaperone for outer membrane proteins
LEKWAARIQKVSEEFATKKKDNVVFREQPSPAFFPSAKDLTKDMVKVIQKEDRQSRKR